MTNKGLSPIAPGPIDSCRGRSKAEPIFYITTLKQVYKVDFKKKTIRNRAVVRN